MGTNPYEAPRSEIGEGSTAPPLPGLSDGTSSLPPEVDLRAMALLGQKRSRSAGASFAVAWAVCIGLLIFVTGVAWAFVVGGILAGVISRAWVQSKTAALVAEVCDELGLPPGSFRPEQYLL
jgi:hypothetical protein